jgi:DNA-directed RNA polymerase subunit alpha
VLLQTSDVKIKKVSEDGSIGVFEFSPLPAGFGRTLGNTLRRILLTSLSGAAITEVRIPKVSHQFSTVTGVKEDVVEICLNLKGVAVKIHGDDPVIGKIESKGEGAITAGDINISSEVEIMNKKHHVAQLADSKASFEAEITVEPGIGYSPVEDRKTSKVGVILIDALFSPVKSVSYEVESTRMGDVIGLDKLIITVETDGSITPEDAVIEASTIVRNFFSRFARGPDPEELIEEEDDLDAEQLAKGDEIYVDDLSLPTRTVNALKKADIETLAELSKLSDEELADIKNLGEKSIVEIKKLLAKEGYEA